MATSREYADFIMSKFSRLDVVSIKPMMGEYVIHMAGKVLGFLGDDQMIFEPGPTIERLLPNAEKRELFPGSKLFYIIPDGLSPAEVCAIAEAIYDDLPVSKPRKPRGSRKTSSGKASDASKPGKSSKPANTVDPSPDPFPFAKHIDW